MYDYLDAQESANVVGSFSQDKHADFKAGVKQLLEGMKETYSIDPIRNITDVLSLDTMKEAYKEQLLGDVLHENFEGYYADLPKKVEQLFENSALEIVRESAVAQLAPIVGISLPVLKKNFLESHAKDIVMTEVPDKPIVKVAFERKFLKDREGNRHYIPEIFYDGSYKTIMAQGKGKLVNQSFHPIPVLDLNILQLSGGSIQTRDTLAYDFVVEAVQIEVLDDQGAPTLKLIDGLNITPDMGSNNTFSYRIQAENADKTLVKDMITGSVDFYYGTVSVSTASGKVKSVRFGGHLSNENNVETVELDRQREVKDWKIPDGFRLNTGLTIERMKDYKALFNIDITTDIISDMSTVLTQMEDSETLGFLDDSLARWKGKKELPFGYTEGFVESYEFDLIPPSNTMVTQSQFIASELPYRLNREIDHLKLKLKTEEIMFVMYGHPNNLTLLQDTVRWIIDEDTKIGGIQLEYKFGVLTANKNRIHVVSSLKVAPDKGIRIVAYPLSKEVITFKHLKYSFNIENIYRNALTPNTPNIMATSRYITKEVLPVQGEFKITGNEFGRKTI